jgi:hypothetical protein
VELLDPLAIEDVRLAAGDVLDVAGVDEKDLEAALFEDIIDRDPVDAGTCPVPLVLGPRA